MDVEMGMLRFGASVDVAEAFWPQLLGRFDEGDLSRLSEFRCALASM
jgi:hypothetical protein